MTTSVQHRNLDLDTKLLADFVFALNIVRRQVLAYPEGHPMVASSAAKLVAVVPQLLEFRSDITLGIARDALVVEGEVLDQANPVFRDLAKNLFTARIASLTVTRDLNEGEVCRFFAIFRQSPEQLAAQGGVEMVLAGAKFKGVRAQGIDFSAFGTTEATVVHAPRSKVLESDAALLWKAFAGGMTRGNIDPNGVALAASADLDPGLLAEIMNQQQTVTRGATETTYEAAIATFLKQADQDRLRDQAYQETFGRLGDMVGKLKPEVRRKFLNSMLKSCAERPATAEALLNRMPQAALLDAFEHLDASRIEIPQTLMDVLGKLSSQRGDGVSRSRVAGEASRSSHETAAQLITLFSEDRSAYFVPKDYQEALALLAAAKVDHSLDKRQVDLLVASLASHRAESQFSAILLDLIERGVDAPTADAIVANLDELVEYFLETGDFIALSKIHRHLYRRVAGFAGKPFGAGRDLLERFAGEEFTATVLDGLDTWGKEAHASIQNLIGQVGLAFAEPLLARLADEPSMSRRRFFMSCLVCIGPQVQGPIAARLADDRWFFVRNLVIVLREVNDPDVVPLLGRLSGCGHSKVQFEVMKTYLHYGDDRARRFLHKELAGKNPVLLLNAIRLAADSRDSRIAKLLVQVLNRRLPAEHEQEIKVNAIKALQESAGDEVLPELAEFFLGKKLFGGGRSVPLKVAAVAILEKIGTVDAGLLAGRIAQSTSGELARAAEEVLIKIHGKLT